ncbi:MAG TPA: DUF2760 domain-containing protein [Caldilineaceae bacterium]|nr:DUF2760 domain-containing protein [Caldilineaceae bacterium]
MSEKQSYRLQTLLIILVMNALLLAAIYWFAGAGLPDQWLVSAGIGLLVSLVLWFFVQALGVRLAERLANTSAASAIPPSREERPRPTAPAVTTAAEPAPSATAGAIQILAILQRQGRLIDFLQEDLTQYEDAQIGAAVRSVHEASQKALGEYVKLKPIFDEYEGATVTVPPGFDARQVRLSGNVVGDPPFKGELRHRGWRVVQIDLPQQRSDAGQEMVVAPAEVEIGV